MSAFLGCSLRIVYICLLNLLSRKKHKRVIQKELKTARTHRVTDKADLDEGTCGWHSDTFPVRLATQSAPDQSPVSGRTLYLPKEYP
jgi:hypothetical protein